MKRDSLEGTAHAPMYNPNILPLSFYQFRKLQIKII